MGLCVFARSDDPVYYLAVRAFVGAPARCEDAASGAANATPAAWLASKDALPSPDGPYRISQGREVGHRSEEPTSELQSLKRTSSAVFCMKKQKQTTTDNSAHHIRQ